MRALWILLLLAGAAVATVQLGLNFGEVPATSLGAALVGEAVPALTPVGVVADWLVTTVTALFVLGFLIFAIIDGLATSRVLSRLRRLAAERSRPGSLSQGVMDAVRPSPALGEPMRVLFGAAGNGGDDRSSGSAVAARLPVEHYLGREDLVDRPLMRGMFEPLPLLIVVIALVPLVLGVSEALLLVSTPDSVPLLESMGVSFQSAANIPLVVAAIVIAVVMKLVFGLVLEARYAQTRKLHMQTRLLLNEADARASGGRGEISEAALLQAIERLLDGYSRSLQALTNQIADAARAAPTPRQPPPVAPRTSVGADRNVTPPRFAREDEGDEPVVTEIAAFLAEAEADLGHVRPGENLPNATPDDARQSGTGDREGVQPRLTAR